MPMNWNAEADAKLFAAVIKVHAIKLDYQSLAKEMGPDCTPKAITHRISKMRSNYNSAASTPSTPSAKRSRPIATPKSIRSSFSTPKSSTKKRIRKPADSESEDNAEESAQSSAEKPRDYDEEESATEVSKTPSKDRKALRRSVSAKPMSYAGLDAETEIEDDDDEEIELPVTAKKLKVEQVGEEA